MAIALTIITSMLVSATVIGAFFAAYFALLHYGWEPMSALCLTGGLFVLTTAVFVLLTILSLRSLQIMRQPRHGKSSVSTQLGETIDAFLDGFESGNTL